MSDQKRESEMIASFRSHLNNFISSREEWEPAKVIAYCLLTLGAEIIEVCWGDLDEEKISEFIRTCIEIGRENAYHEDDYKDEDE